MFDMSPEAELEERFKCEVPDPAEEWTIGLIVGPSGSGKTTIARQAFGEPYIQAEWDDRPVVDNFPANLSIKTITEVLTAVGLSSPPSWIKPYRVLSNGQQFRCDLARALLSQQELVVFDEFTSVVDRTVGRIASAALAKYLRRAGRPKFVAVTCHYDVLDWLQPDWVLDMATRELTRRCLCRRPDIRLDLFETDASYWPIFAHHHYLDPRLEAVRCARCFLGCIEGSPAAFVAVRQSLGHSRIKRISRVVVLPDFQGVGIGGAVTRAVAQLILASGFRCTLTTSHPAMIRSLMQAPDWKLKTRLPFGRAQIHKRTVEQWLRTRMLARTGSKAHLGSAGRPVCQFEYIGSNTES